MFGMRTLVTAMIGAASFPHGVHNWIAHPDLGAADTWVLTLLSAVLLVIVAADVCIAISRRHRSALSDLHKTH